MEKSYCTAIVLAAGRGNRMGTEVHKQYLLLAGKPIVCYSLQVFQESDIIDEIILVTGEGEEDYCRKNFVETYGITKVSRIVTGGKERFHSVWNGLREIREDGYVFIHDSARPFVDEEMLLRLYEIVRLDKACVAGMPVKDTIKIVDSECKVKDTPDRSTLWMVQTPQVFETRLVKRAYEMLMQDQEKQAQGESGGARRGRYTVTDDAGAVEIMLGHPVRMVKGSYKNIKITTPEDLEVGEVFAGRGNS